MDLIRNHLATQHKQYSYDDRGTGNPYFTSLPPPGGPKDQYTMHSLSSALQVHINEHAAATLLEARSAVGAVVIDYYGLEELIFEFKFRILNRGNSICFSKNYAWEW